ncbi:septation protein IspZ [Caldichromatium japonicum]|uniref:Inner membrane-spanning protein YciB n=1 Tax=Caldichromatium japonicum TaxID=2699430 RepID=A0A6G7VDK8_9GAMM|nr:inner membrane-spanning protein YciB [Caldichromatium japonicum]QIK37990.1 septation protein IspZ [Caldichromatium japonicum]
MKLLRDLLPVLLFFAVYQFSGIYWATAAAIAVAVAQGVWTWMHERRIEPLPLATLVILLVFGSLTIALQDPIFVMWKPTLVNWLLAAAFIASHWLGERPLIERLMGQAVALPRPVWCRLNAAWSVFWFALGLLNLFVVYIGSGFYPAYQALRAATGTTGIDLAGCLSHYAGSTLALCEQAQRAESIWVNFKLFGLMGLTIAFVIAQAVYLARHLPDEPRGA